MHSFPYVEDTLGYWVLRNIAWGPGGWFCINMFVCFSMCYAIKQYMAFLGDKSVGFVQVRGSAGIRLACKHPH